MEYYEDDDGWKMNRVSSRSWRLCVSVRERKKERKRVEKESRKRSKKSYHIYINVYRYMARYRWVSIGGGGGEERDEGSSSVRPSSRGGRGGEEDEKQNVGEDIGMDNVRAWALEVDWLELVII